MLDKKTVPAKLYLAAKANLTLPELKAYADTAIPTLCAKIEALGLKICAPLEFIYFGIDGKPETRFDLIVAFPINDKKEAAGQFEYYESEPFQCVYMDYNGGMAGIGEAWGAFVNAAMAAGLAMTGQYREVYKNWVAEDSGDNVTELQIGVF